MTQQRLEIVGVVRAPSTARSGTPAAVMLSDKSSISSEIMMNKDHIKGGIKDIAGKAQEKAGEITGSEKQQIKGLKNQAEGKIQKGVGDVKDAFKDANNPDK